MAPPPLLPAPTTADPDPDRLAGAAETPIDPPGAWDPVCTRPRHLVWPQQVGRKGLDGLTWRVASGSRYVRVAPGYYVPAGRHRSVEQRIVEASARLAPDGSTGCVSAWAALRWRGAAYFDGTATGTDVVVPVVIATGGRKLAPVPGVRTFQHGLAPSARSVVEGLPVTTVQRALLDEVRRLGDLWAAVQAIDMAAAAGLISAWLFARYVAEANSLAGAPLARRAVALAVDESRSPRETWLRLVWLLLAELPPPLVNVPLFAPDGRFLAMPDLFDPVAGLAVEYAGAVHLDHRRRRADLEREERMRAYGLEVVEVVRGDSRSEAAQRLVAARARACSTPPGARRWTLDVPTWWQVVPTLDARLEAQGLADRLTLH